MLKVVDEESTNVLPQHYTWLCNHQPKSNCRFVSLCNYR